MPKNTKRQKNKKNRGKHDDGPKSYDPTKDGYENADFVYVDEAPVNEVVQVGMVKSLQTCGSAGASTNCRIVVIPTGREWRCDVGRNHKKLLRRAERKMATVSNNRAKVASAIDEAAKQQKHVDTYVLVTGKPPKEHGFKGKEKVRACERGEVLQVLTDVQISGLKGAFPAFLNQWKLLDAAKDRIASRNAGGSKMTSVIKENTTFDRTINDDDECAFAFDDI